MHSETPFSPSCNWLQPPVPPSITSISSSRTWPAPWIISSPHPIESMITTSLPVKSLSMIWNRRSSTIRLKLLLWLSSVMTLLRLLLRLRRKSVRLLRILSRTKAHSHKRNTPEHHNILPGNRRMLNTLIKLNPSMKPPRLFNTFKPVLPSPKLNPDSRRSRLNSPMESMPYSSPWSVPSLNWLLRSITRLSSRS